MEFRVRVSLKSEDGEFESGLFATVVFDSDYDALDLFVEGSRVIIDEIYT